MLSPCSSPERSGWSDIHSLLGIPANVRSLTAVWWAHVLCVCFCCYCCVFVAWAFIWGKVWEVNVYIKTERWVWSPGESWESEFQKAIWSAVSWSYPHKWLQDYDSCSLIFLALFCKPCIAHIITLFKVFWNFLYFCFLHKTHESMDHIFLSFFFFFWGGFKKVIYLFIYFHSSVYLFIGSLASSYVSGPYIQYMFVE